MSSREWSEEHGFPIEPTKYGFHWGPAEVIRCCDDKRAGVLITVLGKNHNVDIRVTPSGMVRVTETKPRKRRKPNAG